MAGGPPVTVCDAPTGDGQEGAGMGRGRHDRVCACAAPGVSLWRVSSAGGKAEPLATLAEGELNQRGPRCCRVARPCSIRPPIARASVNDANLVVQPLPSGARKVVHRGGYHGRYLPSGHLVYLHDGVLFAVPFDPDQLDNTGPTDPCSNRDVEHAYRRRTVCRFDRRHVGVSAGADHPGRDTRPLVVSPGHTAPLWAPPGIWFNLRFRSRWSSACHGRFLRTIV